MLILGAFRSPGSSEKLRGSEEKLISRFDGRSSEKRKSRRSGEESGSGDRLISGSSSRKNSSNTKTSSSIATSSSIKTPSSIGSSSKMLQGSSAASSPPKSSSAVLANSSKSSAAPTATGPSIAQKKDTSDSSRLEVPIWRIWLKLVLNNLKSVDPCTETWYRGQWCKRKETFRWEITQTEADMDDWLFLSVQLKCHHP